MNTIRLAAVVAGLAAAVVLASCARPRPTLAPSAVSAIDRLVAASGADVAVAMRTLDGRQAYSLRADESFHAASMMKVPVMIEMFRQARAGRIRPDEPVKVLNRFRSIVDGSPFSLTANGDSEPALYKALGETRTSRQLCDLMITVSSNLAANILIDRLGVENIRQTTASLGASGMNVRRGVEDTKAFEAGQNNTTTARALLVLFDAIARGRAVSRSASQEMVEILARQKFNERLPAGLPPGTRVAHKTGSITRIQHDAGIVFRPRPYVLVVLVRGLDDEKKAHHLIAEITRVVDEATNGGRR